GCLELSFTTATTPRLRPPRSRLIGISRTGTLTSRQIRNAQGVRFGEKSGCPVNSTKARTVKIPHIVSCADFVRVRLLSEGAWQRSAFRLWAVGRQRPSV